MAKATKSSASTRLLAGVVSLGFLQVLGYIAIGQFGSRFTYEIPDSDRPIVVVTTLYIAIAAVSILACLLAVRIQVRRKRLLWMIIGFALLFRFTQLFSPPFQEVDLYRYIWDGKVTATGVSPYRYSPAEVIAGQAVQLSPETDTTRTILSRVHFGHLTTPYPPISQAVFAVSMAVVPETASITTHLFVMKLTISLFDLATLFVLIRLLIASGRHVGWSMAYGWNALVIKEFANSGHLDSIAVFLTVLAFYCMVRNRMPLICGVALGLGFAAKLFPIVFVPILAVNWVKQVGGPAALRFIIAFTLVGALAMVPMVTSSRPTEESSHEHEILFGQVPASGSGLSAFLTQWRMNDLAFSLVYDNLRASTEQSPPWYRFVTAQSEFVATHAYSLARMTTLALWCSIYVWILRRHQQGENLMNSSFLIVASFYYLLPTQNPWYWTWALPFLCFVHNRGWMLVTPALFVYYLRFWLASLDRDYHVGGYVYSGTELFNYVVVWGEHLVSLAAVLLVAIYDAVFNVPSPCSRTPYSSR